MMRAKKYQSYAAFCEMARRLKAKGWRLEQTDDQRECESWWDFKDDSKE